MLLCSCRGSTPTGPRPKASLGQSGSSQLEFRELSRAWHAASATDRQKLEQRFRDFLEQYPRDELRRPARVYLGWLLIQKGELVEARELISEATNGPSGVAQDFALVAEAALLTHHGQGDLAMKLLRPLQGKIIDPIERFLATEQLVHSAMSAHYHVEAMLYSIDWVEQAPERDRDQVRAAALSMLHRVPRAKLERALLTLEPQSDDPDKEQAPARYAEKLWLYDAISRRLAGIAIEAQDIELAQRVLTHSPAVARDGEDPEELVRLATGGEKGLRFSSRTVGLLLTTEIPLDRTRSSEVAAILRASLPAEDFDVHFREDDGSSTRQALNDLAAGGAALIVAGLSTASASRVANYAQRAKIPILLLEKPQQEDSVAFTLGISTETEEAILFSARPPKVNAATIQIRAADCADENRAFSTAEWQKASVKSIMLLGDARCARELLDQLAERGFWPELRFGLHASSARNQAKHISAGFIQAGYFPGSASAPADLSAFVAARGRSPTWAETLGHDAAKVAEETLGALPAMSSSDVPAIEGFYLKIQQALLAYSSSALWSSEAASFDSHRQLVRVLSYKQPPP